MVIELQLKCSTLKLTASRMTLCSSDVIGTPCWVMLTDLDIWNGASGYICRVRSVMCMRVSAPNIALQNLKTNCAAVVTQAVLCRSENSTSSYQLSEQLLAQKAAGAAPQYGTLVFNDSIIADIAQPFMALNTSLADIDAASLLALLPLGLPLALPLNPRAAAGSALAGLSRPESRVISDAVRRFRQHPGDLIMACLVAEKYWYSDS